MSTLIVWLQVMPCSVLRAVRAVIAAGFAVSCKGRHGRWPDQDHNRADVHHRTTAANGTRRRSSRFALSLSRRHCRSWAVHGMITFLVLRAVQFTIMLTTHPNFRRCMSDGI